MKQVFHNTNFVLDLLAREGVLMTDKLPVLEEKRKNKPKILIFGSYQLRLTLTESIF